MKWNTQYEPHKVKGEENKFPSQTIPNEAMSIREILVRYSRGMPIDTRVPIYDEENDLGSLNPRKMDLADIQELREQYTAELAEIKQRQKENEDKKKKQDEEKAAREQKFQEEFELFKQKMEGGTRTPQGGPVGA